MEEKQVSTVELGNKELFGHHTVVHYLMPIVHYLREVNWTRTGLISEPSTY